MQNECPQCLYAGPENFFTTLCSTNHFRCRMCGWMWCRVQEEQDQEPEDKEEWSTVYPILDLRR